MRYLTIAIILFFNKASLIAQQSPVKVTTVSIAKRAQSKKVTGKLVNQKVANLASQEAGLILDADFRQGDIVKKGTILYKLDDKNLQLDLRLAKSELKNTETLLAQKEIDLNFHSKELTRRQTALKSAPGLISEEELAKHQHNFSIAKEDLKLAQNNINQNKIKIEIIEKQINDMVIKAPFDGFLRIKGKEEGEWVDEGESLAVLTSLNTYEAHFEIPQSISLNSLIKIKEVEVKVEGAEKTYIADQFNFIAGVNENSRNYTLGGIIKGTSLDLISGKSISAHIPLGSKKSYLKINSNAIIKDPAGYFVYKVTPMGPEKVVAMQAVLTVEFIEGQFHYCTSPSLKADDKIVTEGNERLRPMSPIMVIGEIK